MPTVDSLDFKMESIHNITSQQEQFYDASNVAPRPAMPQPALYENLTEQQWNDGGPFASGYAQPFQDIFFSSLDSFNVGMDFANSEAFLGPQQYTRSNGVQHIETTANDSSSSMLNAIGDEQRRRALVEHFVQSTNPISVILPTHTEWTSACRSLLVMATESIFLLSSICALSALNIHTTKNESTVDEAFGYYKLSSRLANEIFNHPNVEDRQLKQAFATVFLLTHAEVCLCYLAQIVMC